MAIPIKKIRTNPRVSINQLVRYMHAHAHKRRTILSDAKYPNAAASVYYRDAAEAIRNIAAANFNDAEVLAQKSEILAKPMVTDFQMHCVPNCAEAVQRFADDCMDDLVSALGPLTLTLPSMNASPGSLLIHGVEISYRPELLVSGTYRGKAVSGVIKFYFDKKVPLSEDAAKAIAFLGVEHLKNQGVPAAQIKNKFCLVVDVFHGGVYPAPGHTKTLQDVIRATCLEIDTLWETI